MLRALCTDVDKIGNRFKLIEEIGSGAFGSVSKAYDSEKKLIVALKQLKDREFCEEKVVNEITILKKLQHPNIVKIYDIFYSKSEDSYYISMEYCEQDLMALLETNKLQPQHLKCFMNQILHALQYLKDQNIVHQDIKPANILVQDGRKVKLADFGLAFSYPQESDINIDGGTPAYCSPEKLFGATKITSASDIWSAGVLFYQLISQNLIFTSDSSTDQILVSILNICGAPDLNQWPEVKTTKNYSKFIKYANPSPTFNTKFTEDMITEYGNIINHIKMMLNLIPSNRPTAEALLKSNDFNFGSITFSITEEFHLKHKNYKNIILEDYIATTRPILPKPTPLFV